MTAFETLYDLALRILTDPAYTHLTLHGARSVVDAEAALQRDLLTTVMPGEDTTTPWGIIRIYSKNFVNRSQPPARMTDVQHWLDQAQQATDPNDRLTHLMSGPAIEEVKTAIRELTALDQNFAPHDTCLDWISERIQYWRQQPCSYINTDSLLTDIEKICAHPRGAFRGMGIAVTANLFADLGLTVFAKPDLHVKPVVSLLALTEPDDKIVIRAIVALAKRETDVLGSKERFTWLTNAGGLYPRHIDRLIYLIGSDNHGLTGRRKKRMAPNRRRAMIDALRDRNIISSVYADLVG